MHLFRQIRMKPIKLINICLVITTSTTLINSCWADSENSELLDKEYGVRYATPCEVCKYSAKELQDSFEERGQTSQVLDLGYQLDGPRKKIDYKRSELYYIEASEDVCERLLGYNIHKERKDSNRFARGKSSTFNTLDKLVDKGVKVDLGIPKELWDSPSAEITQLKQQCEDLVQKHDEIVEQWYWGDRKVPLIDYLCRDRVLKNEDSTCLTDPPPTTRNDEL